MMNLEKRKMELKERESIKTSKSEIEE